MRRSSAVGADASMKVVVTYVPESRRFEATVSGSDEVAFLDVAPGSTLWILRHTEVPKSLQGRGIGTELVRQALAHVRRLGASVKPVCPFTASYIIRHPEEADLVRPEDLYMVQR